MEGQVQQGIQFNGEWLGSGGFQKILLQWLTNHQNYWLDGKESDSLYWYTEMANVSILSAAIWQQGGTSLCEFQLDKKNQKEEEIRGRADLWFRLNDTDYWAEAKQRWPSLGPKSNYATSYSGYWDAVAADVRSSLTSELRGDTMIGLLFLTPSLPIPNEPDNEKAVDQFIQFITLEKKDWHFCAYNFSTCSPTLDGFLYPGVCLLGKFFDESGEPARR